MQINANGVAMATATSRYIEENERGEEIKEKKSTISQYSEMIRIKLWTQITTKIIYLLNSFCFFGL